MTEELFIISEASIDPAWRVGTIEINGTVITTLSFGSGISGWKHYIIPDAVRDRLEETLKQQRLLQQGIIDSTGFVG